MFGFRKKTSSFSSTKVNAGRSPGVYVRPTKKELEQLRSEKRTSNVPFGVKKQTRRSKAAKALKTTQRGFRAAGDVFDGVVSFGNSLPDAGLSRSDFGLGFKSKKNPWSL
jgi:hypothetical protein